MAWASKKQYAILTNNEDGKDLILKLPNMTQEEFQKAFGEFLKGNNIPYEEDKEESNKIDLFNGDKTKLNKTGEFLLYKTEYNQKPLQYLDIQKIKDNEKEVIDFLSKPFDYKVANNISELIGRYRPEASQDDVLSLYETYNPSFNRFDYTIGRNNTGIIPREQSEWYIKEQKRKEELQKAQEVTQANIEKYKNANPDDIMKELSNDKLYENKSKYETKGGYQGLSKSNRAVQAEEDNQYPLSKWGKSKIKQLYDDAKIVFSDNYGINDYLMSEINKLSDKEIRDNLLDKSSWHHTSKFANETNYYGLKSPKEIYEYILDKKEKDFNYLDKETMDKLKSSDKGKDLILKAPTMEHKELRKAIQDFLKE